MRNRIICGIILSSGALCLGTTWTFVGFGFDWDDCHNWSADCSGIQPYPSTTNDDVKFALTVIELEIVTAEIDDMVMEWAVGFYTDNNDVLTMDSLLLDSTARDVILRVSDGATLVVNGTN